MFKTKLVPLSVLALALISAFSPTADAGPCGGAKRGVDVVGGYRTHVYHLFFRGGERALVTVRGDGDSDLDLFVFDENGNLIVSDRRLGDYAAVTWRPRWTGAFRIEVRNRGRRANTYVIRAR